MTGVRLDRGTGVSDLQQTTREATLQMIGSQRVRKKKATFSGTFKSAATVF
jgi:hypothetical protein